MIEMFGVWFSGQSIEQYLYILQCGNKSRCVTFKKLNSLSWLLIAGLVWNICIVCDFYGRWFAILCNMKATLESLESF